MKVITVCGSMKFKKEMMEISFDLERKGNCILSVVFSNKDFALTEEELNNLALGHFRKIELSDAIYVVNINGYVGASVNKEITYAKSLNKEIIFHEK